VSNASNQPLGLRHVISCSPSNILANTAVATFRINVMDRRKTNGASASGREL